MNLENGLIDQLETALASRELSKRAELLRHVADLFVFGSGKFTDEQIELFDEVMSTLLQTIECAARASFGSRLSRLPDAPRRTIRLLAFDDAPEVAAPVLEHSPRLDETSLAENARSKSQDHLLAIAGRSHLTELVTDVLVERGNSDVAVRTPATMVPASRLSEFPGSSGGRGTTALLPCAFGPAPIFRARPC